MVRLKQNTLVIIGGMIISAIAIVISLNTFQKSYVNCVTTQDARKSAGHFLTFQGSIIPTKLLVPEKVINYYQAKVQCLSNNAFVSSKTVENEKRELESLRFVDKIDTNSKGKLCAILSNNRKVCE